jgi:hypothetical protein
MTERPAPVTRSLILLWIALALGVGRSIWKLVWGAGEMPQEAMAITVVGMSIPFLLLAVLNVLIAKRVNWARIIYTIFVAVALPFGVRGVIGQFPKTPLPGAVGAGQLLILVAAILGLFQAESSRWFKGKDAAASFPAER